MQANTSSRYGEVVKVFLEASVHCLLATRKIYPMTLFSKRLLYGIAVWRCRHPQVVEYIERVVNNTLIIAEMSLLESFVMNVTVQGRVIDRIEFLLSLPVQCVSLGEGELLTDSLTLENALRASLLRAMLADACLPALPDDVDWSLAAVTRPVQAGEEDVSLYSQLFATSEWIVEAKKGTGNCGINSGEINIPNVNSGNNGENLSSIIPISSFQSQIFSFSINHFK